MSRRYLCIACWRAEPLEALHYTCSTCSGDGGGPGGDGGDSELPFWARSSEVSGPRPVASLQRSWWRRLWTDSADIACPRHPQADLQLYCSCGAPVTGGAELGRGGALAIGFAGPTSAGKTLAAITTIRELRAARVAGQKVSLLGLADTEKRFGALVRSLFADRMKPDATAPERPPGADGALNFAWELAVTEGGDRRRDRDALVAVNDLAGEVWGKPSHEPHEALDRYLEHLGGVVFLVDGAALADDLGLESRDAWDAEPRAGDRGASDRQWLRWLIERLGDRARDVDLALTVSKGDLLWSHQEWAGLEPRRPVEPERQAEPAAARDDDPRDPPDARDARDPAAAALLDRALSASGRGDLPENARARFRRTELFVTSSLGFRPGPGDVDAAGRLVRPPEPRGAEAPVLWLLAQRVRGLR